MHCCCVEALSGWECGRLSAVREASVSADMAGGIPTFVGQKEQKRKLNLALFETAREMQLTSVREKSQVAEKLRPFGI
jgi:hypothetical protein